MQETSISLLERLANDGSDGDWSRLFEIYRPFIYQRISSYPLLADQADDIVQEVLLVLIPELPKFQRQRPGSFRTFLRGVVLNQLRYAMRRAEKIPKAAGTLAEQIESLADPNSDVAAEFDREHDKAIFRHAAEVVRRESNDSHWRAFERHALNGENAATVAEELGVSLNVVLLAKSRLTRRIREEVRGMVD